MYPPRPVFPVAAEEELVPESRELLAAAASLLWVVVVGVSIWLEAEEEASRLQEEKELQKQEMAAMKDQMQEQMQQVAQLFNSEEGQEVAQKMMSEMQNVLT